jgi:hypothetical protein
MSGFTAKNDPESTGALARRTFLRGAGAAVALPFLEAMLPTSELMGRAFAASPPKGRPPLRMAFFYVPNGVHMPSWAPSGVGKLPKSLPSILAPIEEFQKDLLILSGLTQDLAHAHGDGPGDHARAAATFLTGAHPLKTGGKDIRAGVSVDQFAASRIGGQTPFPSLELGAEDGQQSGSCDSGYSCAYSNNIAWKSESMPLAKETYPRQLFERLFPNAAGKESEADVKRRRSVIDYVLEDSRKLKGKLGATDNRKLDEYLVAVREIEERLARVEKESRSERVSRELAQFAKTLPDSRPKDFGERVRLLEDILALTFQADLTRIATFMFANEGSNRSYGEVGVADGHHDLSHHGGKDDKQEKVEKINVFHMQQFAYFLKKLKAMTEGGRSILDHSMIVYGSGISDGDKHNHNMLPILLVGQGGGKLKPGRHIRYSEKTPLNNLFLSMLERMGVPCEKLGDSRGPLPELS